MLRIKENAAYGIVKRTLRFFKPDARFASIALILSLIPLEPQHVDMLSRRNLNCCNGDKTANHEVCEFVPPMRLASFACWKRDPVGAAAGAAGYAIASSFRY
jgi:hypothetical protein